MLYLYYSETNTIVNILFICFFLYPLDYKDISC